MTKLAKLVDTDFLNRKRADREVMVREGIFAEELQSKGKDLNDLKKTAQEVLEISEDDSIIASWEDSLKKQNTEAQAFVSVVNSISKLEGTGMLADKELETLRDSEAKLAEKLAARYGVEVERLYMEDELTEGEE